MKNMKRWTAFVLALLMCLGALAGCASDKTAETQPKANAEADPTAAEATDAAEDPFLTGEKPTLRVLCGFNPGFDMNADIAKAHMEELTGYKVEYDLLPVENASEKLMLEIASGADYDLIYRMGISDYAQLDEKNALMDISDLLEKYGPDILQNATPQMWDQGTHDDGKITGIPYHGGQPADDTMYGMFMGGAAFRTDYLEELGMELPTNLDEFYNVLVAFKDKYGKAPFTSASTGLFSWISSAYGINGGSWYDVDGKLVHMSQLEGFNSDKYIGTGSLTEQKRMWMARARKTEDMAEAFEEMNENADSFIRVDTWENFAYTLPALKQNMPALESAITDILIKGIASADMDAQDVIDEIKATWDREGGPECEQIINEWWAEFSKTLG